MTQSPKQAVLTYLANNRENRFGQMYLPTKAAASTGLSTARVMEALWGLTADQLVFLDPEGQGKDNWRWKLTERGRNATSEGVWEPSDPEGFMDRFRRENPDADDVMLMYYEEALRSYAAQCYLATSVMLGVAAERAFNLMASDYVDSGIAGADKMAQEIERPRSNYSSHWDEFRKRIEPIRKTIPDDLADMLTLDAVADLIRLTRNDSGHPSGRAVDRDTARVHLIMAASYFGKMRKLGEYLKNQKVDDS